MISLTSDLFMKSSRPLSLHVHEEGNAFAYYFRTVLTVSQYGFPDMLAACDSY